MERRRPPIISGKGEATNFKIGWNIHRVHPNKNPLKIFVKRERGSSQDCPNFGGYPQLSQERLKLRTSNFVGYAYSEHQSEEKPIKNFGKVSRGHSRGLPKIFMALIYPVYGALRIAPSPL